MKKILVLIVGLCILVCSIVIAQFWKSRTYNPYELQGGDIVFQETGSTQGKAVKAATGSRWTHVGMVFFKDGQPMVIEAVQPVRITPLKKFIARSPSSFYAMRLKNFDQKVDQDTIAKANNYATKQLGKMPARIYDGTHAAYMLFC